MKRMEAADAIGEFLQAANQPPMYEASEEEEWGRWRFLLGRAVDALAEIRKVADAYESLTRPIRPGEISISPVYGAVTHEPFVQLVWGREAGQWSPEEARAHAFRILQVAEGAVADAFLTRFLAERANLGIGEIAQVVAAYREWRGREGI